MKKSIGNEAIDGYRLKWHLRMLWLLFLIESLPVVIKFIMAI